MKTLEKLYDSIQNFIADKVKYFIAMEVLKATPLRSATFPLSVLRDIENIDEPWSFLFEKKVLG